MATSGPYYLNIHVLDDPEVCKFPQNLYRYDTYEAGVSNFLELYFEEGSYYSKFKIYFIFLERSRTTALYEYKEKETFTTRFTCSQSSVI